MQNLIKIYHLVQELWASLLTGNGRTDGQTASHSVARDALRYYTKRISSLIVIISDRRQSKTLILSMNVDQKSLETDFFVAICRPTSDKWQSKNSVSSDF